MVFCTIANIRNSQLCKFYPICICGLGIFRTKECNLSGMVLVCTISLTEIEIDIANHLLHTGDLQIMVWTFVVNHLGLLVRAVPTGMPEGTTVIINQVTDVSSFCFVTVRTAQLSSSSNHILSDNILRIFDSSSNLVAKFLVLLYQYVVVQNRLELLNKFCNLILRNRLQIPLTGTLIATIDTSFTTHAIGASPEAHVQILVRILTSAVTILMEVSFNMTGIASQTDVEDISEVLIVIAQVNNVVCSIIEYNMADLCLVIGKQEAAWTLFIGICTHTYILHQNAVAYLSKFPYLVSHVLFEGTEHYIAWEVLIVRSQCSLAYVGALCIENFACLGICNIIFGIITHTGHDAVVTILRNLIGNLRIQNYLPHRIYLCLPCVSTFQIGAVRICSRVVVFVVEIHQKIRKPVEISLELTPGIHVRKFTELCTQGNRGGFVDIIVRLLLVRHKCIIQHNVYLFLLWRKLERPNVSNIVGVARNRNIEFRILDVVSPECTSCILPTRLSIARIARTDGILAGFGIQIENLSFPGGTVVTTILTVHLIGRLQNCLVIGQGSIGVMFSITWIKVPSCIKESVSIRRSILLWNIIQIGNFLIIYQGTTLRQVILSAFYFRCNVVRTILNSGQSCFVLRLWWILSKNIARTEHCCEQQRQ